MRPPRYLKEVTLAILAGGQGARMGMPKGRLQLGGRPILEYLLDRFQWPGPTLLITAPGREHPPGWERFTREVTDPEPDAGPLCGVMTALQHTQTRFLLVTAVDMPALGARHLRWLSAAQRRRSAAAGVMVRRQVQDGTSGIEPFPAAFRVDIARSLVMEQFQLGKRSIRALAAHLPFTTVPMPETWHDAIGANLNEPASVEAFERVMKGS